MGEGCAHRCRFTLRFEAKADGRTNPAKQILVHIGTKISGVWGLSPLQTTPMVYCNICSIMKISALHVVVSRNTYRDINDKGT